MIKVVNMKVVYDSKLLKKLNRGSGFVPGNITNKLSAPFK